jgi:hypothetical protein
VLRGRQQEPKVLKVHKEQQEPKVHKEQIQELKVLKER